MAERTDNPSYPIMTINMNGPSYKKGTAETRRNFLSRILKLYPSAIVFCQETCPGFETLMPATEFVKTPDKEAAVIWSTDHFDGSEYELDRTNTTGGFIPRTTMVKLTPKQSTENILAVSFHGPHTRFGVKEKKTFFLSLLEFLDQVIIKEKYICCYIIGGDFNFNTRTILRENVVVGKYELSPRSKNKKGIPYKDNFVYYRKPNLNVSSITAVDLNSIDTKENVIKDIDLNSIVTKYRVINAIDLSIETKESVRKAIDLNSIVTKESVIKAIDLNSIYTLDTEESKLLDHDPIVGKLHFTPQTEEGSPSEENSPSELLEKLAISEENPPSGENSPSEENLTKDLEP